jgi:hypothetical protein
MDRLIVDQLGCMAIARTENEDKASIQPYQTLHLNISALD